MHKDSIPIDKIYFPLQIESNKIFISPLNASEIFKDSKRIIIEGKGGSGKTTLIKHLYINCIKTNYKIPILINLRDFNLLDLSENRKRIDIINNVFYKETISLFVFNKIGINSKKIIELLDSGNFLFILDGYDEIGYDIKSYLFKDIEEFVIRFNKNNFIITTRPYTEASRLTNFNLYRMCALNEKKEIAPFIHKQLFNNPDFADSIIETLGLPSSKKYIPLLGNPLFLVLFINSFESYPCMSSNKSVLVVRECFCF